MWQNMETAPKDGRQILVRRHNDITWEYHVVWWAPDRNKDYPWQAEYTAYPLGRLDDWMEIPK